MRTVLGPSRHKSCAVQEGSEEARDGCVTLRQGQFSQASGISSHPVLGMLGVQLVRAEGQGEH